MKNIPFPIAVLVSGGGSNLQALIDAARTEACPYEIVLVISDRPGVQGLDRAVDAGLCTEIVEWAEYDSREAFTAAICSVAHRHGARAMILAGFMRILDRIAMERFPDAIINVHPSLLPSFPGARGVEDALEYGVRITGVTVHFVEEQVDCGPIISQRAIEVYPDDDAETLHARIQKIEHWLLPEAVEAFVRGNLRVEKRHVRWRQPLTKGEI